MLLGKKLGLDQQILGDIINTSTGQSWASSVSGFVSELDMERALTGLSSFAVSSLPLPKCAPPRFARRSLAQTNFPVPHVKIGESSPAAHRDYANGFLSALAHKDLVLALRAAESVDSPLYTGELTERVYREMMSKNEEMGQRDFSVVYKYLEEVVGSGSGKP
jgi:3-hydroxyisobutyrate dehydrogenase